MTTCIRCKGWPCICHYLDRLGSGDMDPRIVQLALERAQEPHAPILSCPCPECYRVRLASWEVSA